MAPGPVYLSLLGNDPAPAYLGLKTVARRAGGVAKAIFYALRAWGEGYEAKRQALFALLEEKGIPHEVRPLSEAPAPEEGTGEVWANLTGGSKLFAVRLLGRLRRPGARVFLLEAHRPLEAPRALFLWPEEGAFPLEAEALTLEEYARLYLEPLGEAWAETPPPPAFPFPKGARTARLPRREGGLFVVYRGRPYWFRPFLGSEAKDMARKALARFAEEARELGGQLCLPVVPHHAANLRNYRPNEREKVLARWRAWAEEYGVFLVDPGPPLEREVASLFREKPLPKAPPPSQGPVLLALVSEQAAPLYGAYLYARPKEAYLLTTPEMEGRLRWAEAFFRDKGVRVHAGLLPGPWALWEVRDLFSPVVEEALRRGHPVHANLNGGTHAMALGLYLALREGARAHYLEGDRLLFLEGGEARVPWEEGRPEDLLALRGYRLQERCPSLSPDPEVLAAAKGILRRWAEVQASWKTSPVVDQFLRLFARRLGCAFPPKERESLKGLALEYFVYFHLHQHLVSRGGTARMGGHLVPLGDGALAPQSTEVDGVFFHRGTLWFVECKPDAASLKGRAPLMRNLVASVGGSRARGLMVARSWEGGSAPSSPNLVYMALEVGEGVQGVYRFPQDLEEALGLAGL
ncbi:hypothetical protein [Thermus sp.]|uniref:hypothetical protein n=1 Tax=Thermus sp. TaxID=275 RepID=UPI003D14EC0F